MGFWFQKKVSQSQSLQIYQYRYNIRTRLKWTKTIAEATHVCCHNSKWFVLSSRPAISFIVLVPVVRKSSNPSPPEMINMWLKLLLLLLLLLLLGVSELLEFRLRDVDVSQLMASSSSIDVKKRTWPVWPCGMPLESKVKESYINVKEFF